MTATTRARRVKPPWTDVKTSVPVVVLKMARDDYAHGRLGVVRSLGRLGVPVYCLHESRRTPAALSRYAREHLEWPIADTPRPETLADLLRLGVRLGQRPVLLPTDDVGTLFVDEHADELRPVFRFPEQPRGLPARLADKGELYRLCRRLGIPTPETAFPRDHADVECYARAATFPVVVKSMDPRVLRERPTAKSVALAQSPAELMDLYAAMEVPERPNLMFQEYVPGGAESVWMFNGYFDRASEALAAFTGRKVRQHPPATGSTSLGVCVANETIEAATRKLMKEVGYHGIVDMGYRYDARDGQYKLLDVNPRLGSTFRLFVSRNGVDVVRALYLDLTDQAVPPSTPNEDRRWVVEPFDLWTTAECFRRRTMTRREWLASLRGVQEAAWFAADDPLPFLGMVALFTAQPLYRRAAGGRYTGRAARALRIRLRGEHEAGDESVRDAS